MNKEIVILGAGIAGLSAAYHLKEAGIPNIVAEKENTYGGLCNSFEIRGFMFDTFAHISFDNEETTYHMLEGNVPHWTHESEAVNFNQGSWIKNPVQNNLAGLPVEERIRIIKGFIERTPDRNIENYGDWLRAMFGDYFAEKFPYKYTRKYWTVEPEQLESNWIKGRMYTPALEEVLRGAMEEDTRSVHYSKEARYPVKGGFKSFLDPLVKNADIRYCMDILEIDPQHKVIRFGNGEEWEYDKLISTIPLPELCHIINTAPESIRKTADRLDYTSGVMVSIGLARPCVSPALWFYIYDEEILPARVYAPDIKSPNNVPHGCSALQAEIYYSRYKKMPDDLEELKEDVIHQMLRLNLFKEEDIVVSDVRMKQYANIMFTPEIFDARDAVHQYLKSVDIEYAGRWGEWDYLWVGQSFRSGRDAAERCIKQSF